MQCLIRGLHYLTRHFPDECYYWENPNQPSTRKVPFELTPDLYPYIIVNIGSGVSILLVNSATDFKRIGGTSVGGGTFLGLSALLAGTQSFEEAIALAEKGDSNRVDKLVRDIYGGDYAQFGLSGDVVASRYRLFYVGFFVRGWIITCGNILKLGGWGHALPGNL